MAPRRLSLPSGRLRGTGARAGDGDNPMIDFITAACNAWAGGLSALQAIARQTGAAPAARPGQEAVDDPLSALIGVPAGLATALIDMVAQRPELSSVGSPGSSDPTRDTHLAALIGHVEVFDTRDGSTRFAAPMFSYQTGGSGRTTP